MNNTDEELSGEWDALLRHGLVEPPVEFHTRVMSQVHKQVPEPVVGASSSIDKVANALQIAVVIVGALAAGWQTLGFIFGLWATSLAI